MGTGRAGHVALSFGAQVAVVDPDGGRLRGYAVGDRAVLDGCAPGERCTAARGDVLLPWPNRVTGARYTFAGVEHRLAVTEPATGAAIHGLARDRVWTVAERSADRVRLQLDLEPAPGYPFPLACTLTYALSAAGLRVRVTATNTGTGPCPYACGAHPYLTVGTRTVDDLTVQVPARTYLPTDGRGTPTGPADVAGTPFDLRVPTRLGARRIDHAYTGLVRDADGRARVRLRGPDGTAVALWADAAHDHLQIFTGDTVPEPGRRRRGLAVEPMTAAPDAFRSGAGLTVLEPGATHAAEWGIEP